MPDIDIKAYIDQLRQRLPYMPPVPVQKIKALHKKGDYGGVVKLIRSTMNVGVRLTIHWTSGPPPKEIPNANAWIGLPETMPYYGTPAFKEQKLDIFRSLIATQAPMMSLRAPYPTSCRTSSWSRSSIHSGGKRRPSMTAMLLGFSYIYRTASHTVRWVDANHQVHSQIGYLNKNEMDAACKILVPTRLRARDTAFEVLRSNWGLLVLVGMCVGAWAIGTMSDSTAHQIALSEANQLSKTLPIKYGANQTLIAIYPGLMSVQD